jgi:hypothetical protein
VAGRHVQPRISRATNDLENPHAPRLGSPMASTEENSRLSSAAARTRGTTSCCFGRLCSRELRVEERAPDPGLPLRRPHDQVAPRRASARPVSGLLVTGAGRDDEVADCSVPVTHLPPGETSERDHHFCGVGIINGSTDADHYRLDPRPHLRRPRRTGRVVHPRVACGIPRRASACEQPPGVTFTSWCVSLPCFAG